MLLKKQKNVLQFWRDIEIFNLPDMPDELNYLKAGSPLPWTIPQEPMEDAKRRYILYFGKQKKLHITELIEKLTGESNEKPDWMEKVTGDTCMAVLVIEEEGTLSEEGAYLQASFLHGLKCLQNEEGMETVVEKLEKVQEAFTERYSTKPISDESGEVVQQRFIGWKELEREISVIKSLNIQDVKCEPTIYCQSIIISKKIKNADTSFLNSFYLNDLNQLINHPKKWNKGLSDYLIPELDPKQRIDLLKDADAFFKTLDPEKMPMGRWPSNPQNGAYAAQLGAMNTALEELKEGGIMGINGPPGTGKTTLLSDIVAEVIVQRAQKLIKANNILMFMPGDIFVISPFKSVADKCRIEFVKNFPKVKCGTIHTFQGKETDTVFLVLGSDPKSEGARRWASAKSNMLNVALTRAKKHFYVIGNRILWQSYSNFDYLSAKLP